MAQGIDALAALQGENDRLRAQLDEVEALRAREAKANVSHLHLQSALAAGSIVGAWNWHPARDAFILDEGFAKVFGLDATFVNVELPIDRVLVNLHPEDRPGLDAAIAEAVARGGVYVHQYRIKRSDGKYYWVEAHGRVDYDAEGTPVSFPGIVMDVNDRRGVEAERNRAITALRESEARVRAMVDQSSAGIAQTTLEGKFIFVNNRFCTMTGRSREELLTLHMHQLTHPDDRLDNVRLVQNLAQGGSSFEMETRYLRSDNSIMWVHNSVTGLRDADGTANSLFAVSLDISEQKSLQLRSAFLLGLTDRLRTEESAASIMAATADLLGAYLGASRVGYSIVQPDNQTIVFESSYVNGVTPLTGSQALDSYDEEAIAAQRRGETFAVSDTRSLETRERWALIDSRAFISVPRIRDGRFKASFYVNYQEPHAWSADEVALIEAVAARTWDAVERAQAEAALRHAHDNLEQRIEERSRALQASQDQLHQSQKMGAIGQLTGGIAHDFNNMLATITSSLELMNRRIASGKGGDLTRYLTLASTAAQSAAALIKRLLAFSRKQTLDLQALDVNAAIAQMEDMLRRTIGEQIQFELALQPGLPSVKSDRNQLENALLNLTINARDAMPEGGVIRISTSRRELDVSYSAMHPEVTPGHYVMVSVSDDGTGMSPEVIAKAFDPFFTTKPIGQG
ncbi:MAG: PAS domain S-box protein, partial [Pseudomonas sp.]